MLGGREPAGPPAGSPATAAPAEGCFDSEWRWPPAAPGGGGAGGGDAARWRRRSRCAGGGGGLGPCSRVLSPCRSRVMECLSRCWALSCGRWSSRGLCSCPLRSRRGSLRLSLYVSLRPGNFLSSLLIPSVGMSVFVELGDTTNIRCAVLDGGRFRYAAPSALCWTPGGFGMRHAAPCWTPGGFCMRCRRSWALNAAVMMLVLVCL